VARTMRAARDTARRIRAAALLIATLNDAIARTTSELRDGLLYNSS